MTYVNLKFSGIYSILHSMDEAKVRKQIEVVMHEVQKLLAIVKPLDIAPNPEVARKIASKICLLCDKPLLENDSVTRNVHHRCYRRLIRDGVDLDHAEKTGLVGPKGVTGRRKEPLPAIALQKMQAEVDNLHDKASEVIKAHKAKKKE